MLFEKGMRVVKLNYYGTEGAWAPAGTHGTVIKKMHGDAEVRWDVSDGKNYEDEWCGREELTEEFVTQPGEIMGDGPMPLQYDDEEEFGSGLSTDYVCYDPAAAQAQRFAGDLNHPTLGPRSETIYGDSELLTVDNLRYPTLDHLPSKSDAPMELSDSEYRKMLPVGTVVTEYWPNAMKGAAAVAWVGNEKHNPGEHLHWDPEKSKDHEDCLARHRIDAKSGDGWDTVSLPDGRVYQVRHAAAALWRAACLAELDAQSVGGEVVRRLK